MKCLLKYQWVKLPRNQLPPGKGIMGSWARLASRAAFRTGQARYCGYTNKVSAGGWAGGIVGLKSILAIKRRRQALEHMDTLADLGYITYSLDTKTKKLTYQVTDWVVRCSGEPCTGREAVYATEGAAPNGVLFQIENTDALQVDVKIKEYDVNSLKPNMAAIIKADATGDEEYDGYLEKISPSAVRTPETAEAANTANTKDVEFDATVVVSSKETNLRIGMTARADIITEQKDNVFAVPYDAISTAADGSSVVYTVKAQEDGSMVAEAVPVTLGLETDY